MAITVPSKLHAQIEWVRIMKYITDRANYQQDDYLLAEYPHVMDYINKLPIAFLANFSEQIGPEFYEFAYFDKLDCVKIHRVLEHCAKLEKIIRDARPTTPTELHVTMYYDSDDIFEYDDGDNNSDNDNNTNDNNTNDNNTNDNNTNDNNTNDNNNTNNNAESDALKERTETIAKSLARIVKILNIILNVKQCYLVVAEILHLSQDEKSEYRMQNWADIGGIDMCRGTVDNHPVECDIVKTSEQFIAELDSDGSPIFASIKLDHIANFLDIPIKDFIAQMVSP